MEKTKYKVEAVADDYTYKSVVVKVGGELTSFVISRDVDVSELKGKNVFISKNASGAYEIEIIKPSKE